VTAPLLPTPPAPYALFPKCRVNPPAVDGKVFIRLLKIGGISGGEGGGMGLPIC